MIQIKSYNREQLNLYLKNDWVYKFIQDNKEYDIFSSQKWLKEIPEHRFMYSDIYQEFLTGKYNKILDIGGGFNCITEKLLQNNSYTLVDIMNRDNTITHKQYIDILERKTYKFLYELDFMEYFSNSLKFDVVIAHNIFPHVDPRLIDFIDNYMSITKNIIFTIWAYNDRNVTRGIIFKKMSHFLFRYMKETGGSRFTIYDPPSTKEINKTMFNNLNFDITLPQSPPPLYNKRTIYRVDIKCS